MPDDFLAYYELQPGYGIDYAGNLEPITDFGLSIAVPQMSGGDVLPTAAHRLSITRTDRLTTNVPARVIPQTRIIETSDVRVATAIHALGLFARIDPPTKEAIADAERETKAHIDAMSKAAEQVTIGNDPPPDATDMPVASEPVETGESR